MKVMTKIAGVAKGTQLEISLAEKKISKRAIKNVPTLRKSAISRRPWTGDRTTHDHISRPYGRL
jgi:hypothetical protein